MLGRRLIGLLLALAAPIAVRAEPLIEPALRMAPDIGPPTVALTLDACGGVTDHRILDVLVAEKIPATIFVTGIWLRRNPQALAVMLAHPDLFQLENHGRHHVPAVDHSASIFGLKAAGSPAAVKAEVMQGRDALKLATGQDSAWYRGAAAVYTESSVAEIEQMGFRVAGYSMSADGGTLFGREEVMKRLRAARDGDVILAHINHPEKTAGQGVAEGMVALKMRGFRFVRLGNAGVTWESGDAISQLLFSNSSHQHTPVMPAQAGIPLPLPAAQ
jgi:peptidoglycan/xylan/chitin deacetylase (PgdA/CDA1 family)